MSTVVSRRLAVARARECVGLAGGGGPRPPDFEPEDVTAIEQQIAGVTAVAPQASTTATAIYEGMARLEKAGARYDAEARAALVQSDNEEYV